MLAADRIVKNRVGAAPNDRLEECAQIIATDQSIPLEEGRRRALAAGFGPQVAPPQISLTAVMRVLVRRGLEPVAAQAVAKRLMATRAASTSDDLPETVLQRIKELIEQGMTPEEAKRAAKLALAPVKADDVDEGGGDDVEQRAARDVLPVVRQMSARTLARQLAATGMPLDLAQLRARRMVKGGSK